MKNFCSLILLICLTSCQNAKFKQLNIVGKWALNGDTNNIYEFTDKGLFNHYINGEVLSSTIIKQIEGGELKTINYGQLVYKTRIVNDSIFLKIVGKENNELFLKHLCFIDKDQLTIVVYKEGHLIDSHIQLVSSFFRVNSERENLEYKKLILHIPENFDKDVIYIAYNQKDGLEPEIGEQGNIYISIPLSGILKTTFQEDVRIMSFGNVRAFSSNVEKEKKEITVFQLEQSGGLNEMNRAPSSLPFLQVERFNPSRASVNKIFGEKIQGNVQTFTMIK